MAWLLDTCVLSEYLRPAPAPAVIRWLDGQVESELFISELSLAEIERGVNMLLSKDVTRARRLAQWLAQLGLRFAERSLSLDRATLRIWASSSAQADLAGQRMPSMDALLMATAQKHGLTIVTRNTCDFARYDKLLDPWQVA